MGLMNEVWKIMDTASKLKEDGKTQEALETYNAAFNMLIDLSGHYAREQEAVVTDLQELRSKVEVLFAHSKDYLKRDNTAATILNEMGLLFMDQGEAENARQKFLEAIDYIPGGEDFSEPADNLERLVSMYVPEEEQSFEE
jgi:tetratricopeptide (TPR) repeat protein